MSTATERFDVVIIGAGVVGSSIARVLSRFEGSFAVVEKAHDVGMAASARNSGVIHAGINYAPDSLRARFCMEGRQLLQQWCRELNVPVSICGKLVIAQSQEDLPALQHLLSQGEANGVPHLHLVSRDEATALQPGVECVAALHVPSSGVVPPYAMTLAMAEDAAANGVVFHLGCEATGVVAAADGFVVETTAGALHARVLVNAAGIHAGRIARWLDPDAPEVYPCVGEYLILDRQVGERFAMSVYPAPRADGAGLGVHITPTVEGNVLLGPSNEYVADPEGTGCTQCTSDRLLDEATVIWPELPRQLVIGAYAGIRAKLTPPEVGGFGDYVLLTTPEHPNALHLLGIESPGLTAAPALAVHVVDGFLSGAKLKPKRADRVRIRRWPDRFDELSEEEKARRVAEDPEQGDIVCRCEGVTKREILHALDNPLHVRTLSGIKFRTRSMMGRCSGGYCLPRIVEILQNERSWSPDDFFLRGPDSPAFAGRLLEVNRDTARS